MGIEENNVNIITECIKGVTCEITCKTCDIEVKFPRELLKPFLHIFNSIASRNEIYIYKIEQLCNFT